MLEIYVFKMIRSNKENRRQLILDSANRLFAQYGIGKTTIDDIAKEADIGKGSIYLEFSSKEEIVMSIVSSFMTEEITKIERLINSPKTKSYLALFKKSMVEHILRTFDLTYLRHHTPEEMIHCSYKVRQGMKELLDSIRQLFVLILEKAAKNRELEPKLNIQKTAALMCMSLDALFPPYAGKAYNNRDLERITRKEIQEQAEGILDLISDGIRRKK
jgi:AcrR family transcriptional regulator